MIDDYGLTREQENGLYNFKIGCEGWFYFEALVNDYACDPNKACNWMINYLFPVLKKQPKDAQGWDLTLIPPDVLAGFIQTNDRAGLKNYFLNPLLSRRQETTWQRTTNSRISSSNSAWASMTSIPTY